jgi:prepilin-type N-terminal cleavage/methylation domain-containing protein
MNAPGVNRGRGFTLLESIIALAMIGSVAGACLQVRAQSLAGRQRLTARQATDRGFETILRLAQSGLLDGGVPERNEAGQVTRITWTGEHLGEPFTCERERTLVANPVDPVGDESLPATITLWAWTVGYGGETARLLTPPGPTG